MAHKLSLENAAHLPSFSRIGKGCSNQGSIKELGGKLEKERSLKKQGRNRIT